MAVVCGVGILTTERTLQNLALPAKPPLSDSIGFAAPYVFLVFLAVIRRFAVSAAGTFAVGGVLLAFCGMAPLPMFGGTMMAGFMGLVWPVYGSGAAVALFSVCLYINSLAMRSHERRSRAARKCAACGYDLRGTEASRCPEGGQGHAARQGEGNPPAQDAQTSQTALT